MTATLLQERPMGAMRSSNPCRKRPCRDRVGQARACALATSLLLVVPVPLKSP